MASLRAKFSGGRLSGQERSGDRVMEPLISLTIKDRHRVATPCL
jgi:hypothetical protein